MQTRLFALGLGLIYLVVGVLAFLPALYTGPSASAPYVSVTTSYGFFLGTFPTNAVQNGINIAIGLAGIIAAARVASARYYCMTMLMIFGLATVFGFIPGLNTLNGVCPLFDADEWVHAASAGLCGYFGFVALEDTNVAPAAAHATH